MKCEWCDREATVTRTRLNRPLLDPDSGNTIPVPDTEHPFCAECDPLS